MLHVFSHFTLVPLSKRASFRAHPFPLLRPLSQVHSSGNLKTNRWRWALDHLISSVSRLLEQEKSDEAVKLFKERVSKIPFKDRTSRSSAYERGITAFLNHKLFKNAVELEQQMLAEGMDSPIGLRAKTLVCSHIVTAPHEQREKLESLYEKLSLVLSLPFYSERNLRELLDVMRCHPLIDLQFVRKLVDVFVKSRGPQYDLASSTINKLIVFYTHTGSMDAAESLVLSQPRHSNAGPYTTLISELAKKDAMSPERLGILLDRMKLSDTPVNLAFMNALVQSAVRRGNLPQAFSLYETILKDPHMIPDSFTFGSLFNALQRLWASRSRKLYQKPPNAPVPRRLFRQMLECHVLADQVAEDSGTRAPTVVRVSTLNVALRLFMLLMDYSGAFVALQTFRALDLRPDARTYRFVLTTLLAHVRAHLQPGQSHPRHVRWAVKFLSGGEERAGVKPEDIRPEIAYALLEFARNSGDVKFSAPSLAVVLGDEKEPENAQWDIEPLERLVVRAIMASMALKGVSGGQAERALREKLMPYFYGMVPERLWKGRRLRRAAY